MKHIGFTGTRRGMSAAQYESVDQEICDIICGDVKLQVVAHHGDCVGADAEFHTIARRYGCAVGVHPPTNTSLAINTPESVSVDGTRVLRYDPLPYVARNKAIVAASDIIIAAPYRMKEQLSGGTWGTIRFARKAGKPLAIVWRDGTTTYERWPK